MSSETKIYVACLASYNAGRLHGAWIDATSDADEMQEAVDAMLRASPCPNVTVACPACEGTGETPFHNSETGETRRDACPACRGTGEVPSAEEYAIHDVDDPFGALVNIGEFCGLDDIADRIETLDELRDDYDDSLVPMLIAWAEDTGAKPDTWRDTISDAFMGVHRDAEDYAAETIENMGIEVPDALQHYIDYRAFARDMALNGEVDFICTATGSHLQDYDSMHGRECLVMACR